MSTFDDRQKAFENKFKVDEELQFKVNIKAVRLFGLWVAGQMGMSGKDAEVYAEEVVESDFEEPGNKDVFRKVMRDFGLRGTVVTEAQMQKEFDKHLTAAKSSMA